MPFLPEREPRPLNMPAPDGIRPTDLFIGSGGMPLEVAVLECRREPTVAQMRDLHHQRVGRRAAPVLIVVLWGDDRAAVCGGPAESLSVHTDLDCGQVERLCDAALASADRHAAIRYLARALPQLTAPIPGLRNEGLFALHELTAGVPRRGDWSDAGRRARPVLSQRGRALVERLGFHARPLPGPAALLLSRGDKVAVAVFLERPDEIDPPSALFDGVSPVSYALAKADHERLRYVVVSAGSALRVYPVKPGVGTGRRGRTETFVELNLDLLRESDAAYLWLLCSADALADGGSFERILASSEEYAADLGTRLRERVYEDVVPRLARAIAAARRLRRPTAAQLAEAYDMALLALFRLLFVAYAEDKELLPLHGSAAYREHSLKHMAQRLLDERRRAVAHGREDFYWTEVRQLWKAVDKGNPAWSVPPYNGGLFSEDGDASAARLAAISLPDAAFAPALAALLLDETPEGDAGPIDFRSLGVREFGTIYEGLLESELSVAETDLAIQAKTQAYVPVAGNGDVAVRAGEVYLHNASGARKSSGAYYTKAFAVEHLLDAALEPAIDDHCARLDRLDDRQAGERFFDFRVADVAMGSGHFLVAAVDRIERRFSNYLAARRLPGVTDELERLRAEALRQLGDDWAGEPLEDTQLLRRQIARRCIFGVDLNPLAVELARLSIWIHTFVPGLPLSLLDRNLVIGNSLVGIATFDEANEILAGAGDLFSLTAAERLGRAREPLQRLARLADATAAEVKQAKELYRELSERTRAEAGLLTILAASRIDPKIREAVDQGQIATLLRGEGDVFTEGLLRQAEAALLGLEPLHFPIAFPQVFLGERGGFDVILGNPPWEKVRVETHGFWARHQPGLRGLTQTERNGAIGQLERERPDLVRALESEIREAAALREVIVQGPFPGMGTGDPDLYKAFCWRFWSLVSPQGGTIGVLLPRSVFSAKGSELFRRALFSQASELRITTLVNRRGWAFEQIHPQFSIVLLAARRARSTGHCEIVMEGPFASRAAFEQGTGTHMVAVCAAEIASWSPSLSLPLLPAAGSFEVFSQMRASPRLDAGRRSWSARPVVELHTTQDKELYDFTDRPAPGEWPVFTGESFDLWAPDTGRYFAYGNPDVLLERLQQRRLRSSRLERSAFRGLSEDVLEDPLTLPCRMARIAFRDVSRATDTRTVRTALVPPNVFLVHKAPFFVWTNGLPSDEAYLLGVLSSIPLDWYARLFVETSLSYDIVWGLPVPDDGAAELGQRVRLLAGRLAAPDDRFARWAAAVGVACGRLDESEKQDMIHELDAAVAHLYGLSEAQLVHIFETFHEGWDYQDRLDATLKHYRALERLI